MLYARRRASIPGGLFARLRRNSQSPTAKANIRPKLPGSGGATFRLSVLSRAYDVNDLTNATLLTTCSKQMIGLLGPGHIEI